jgi:beta-mannosidase
MFREVPTDPEEYILASQISQAEAKKYFIERMRMGRPNKSGIIWWNLLDGWPQMSDAVVDYYFDKKLAYYYIKRSQKPFIIALDELYDRAQKIFACNDTLDEIKGHYQIIDGSTDKVLIDRSFTAAPNTSTHIGNLPMEYSYHTMLIIKWEANGECGINHYTTGFIPYDLEKYKGWLEKYELNK